MKTELTIEQSQKLIELGVDAKLASDEYGGGDCKIIPIFTLSDLLSILPKEIEDNGLTYGLSIWVDEGEWHVKYHQTSLAYRPLSESYNESPELIDALYQLLIWTIENGYIKTDNQ